MQIIRMDRNVLNNLNHFDIAYPNDSTLVKHVIFALGYDMQLNTFPETLWGYKQIDPYKLAPLIGISPTHLTNPSKLPAQLDGLAEEEVIALKERVAKNGDPLWNTNLCSAIWILRTKRKFDTAGWAVEKGMNFSKIIESGFLDHAQKYQWIGRRKKILYEVSTSKHFRTNLACNFSRYDHDLLIKLPFKCRNLYLSLINLREKAFKYIRDVQRDNKPVHPEYIELTPYYALLKAWTNSNNKTERFNKRNINNQIRIINDHAGWEVIKLQWDPNFNNGYKANVTMFYHPEEIELRRNESEERFRVFLFDSLKEHFRMAYRPNEKDSVDGYNYRMKQWMMDHNIDYQKKREIIQATLHYIFRGNHIDTEMAIRKGHELLPVLAEAIPVKSSVLEKYGN
ncbi:MAG: hypothetical protein ABJH04_07785 [Cyclobacteriaceae bacterium]